MRGGFILSTLAVAAALCTTVGCRTPASPTAPAAGIPDTIPALDADGVARADALARYGQGLVDEYNDNSSGALSNFQQAALLDPDNEELNLRVAIGLLQQKKKDEAIALVESFAEEHADAEKSQLFLALVYRASEQYDQVERIYRKMIKRAPRKPEFYIELASLYIKQGNDKAAAELLESAAGKVSDPLDILRLLGGIYMKQSADSTSGKDSRKSRDAAIRAFEQVLTARTNDISILFQLGVLHIQNGQLEKALDFYSRIEEMNPDNLQIRQRLAMTFAETEDKSPAIAALEEVAAKEPDNPRVYYYLGELYGGNGDTTNALLQFTRAAEHSPSDPAPFIKKAILQAEKNPEAAKAALAEGLVKLPGDPRLTEMMGYVFFSGKDYEKAIEHFAKAVESAEKRTPDTVNPTLYYNYAVACLMAGRIPQAASLLGKAMDRNPAYLDAFLQYSFRQTDDQSIQQSIAILEEVGRAKQDEPSVYVYLGILNSYLKTFKAAIAAFEKAESLVGDSPQQNEIMDASFYFWYAAALEREGRFDKAEKLFMKCLELDPQHAEAYNYLAYMWAEKGIKLDQAFKYITKALKLNPKSGAFLDTLGWIYYMNEQYKEALEQVNHAAEIIPDDPTILDHLGDIFFKLGDEKQAIPYWEKSFVLDPGNGKVAEKLSRYGVDLEPLRKQAEELKADRKNGDKTDPSATTGSPALLISPLPVLETDGPQPEIDPAE